MDGGCTVFPRRRWRTALFPPILSYKTEKAISKASARGRSFWTSYATLCTTQALLQRFCHEHGLSLYVVDHTEEQIAQRLQEYRRAPSPKNLLDSGICETYWAFDASQEELTALWRSISAGANQKALRSMGAAFCQTAARHDWVCDMARRIFSEYSRGSSQGFISIGSSRVDDFGGYARFGLRDLRSDEEKIGLGLALLEKAGQCSDLAWHSPVIYCDFPKPGETDEYAICIGFELMPRAREQGEW